MANKITAYLVELGVMLEKDNPEFENYSDPRFVEYAPYDEDMYYETSKLNALEQVREYVNSGVDLTYGIITEVILNLSTGQNISDVDVEPVTDKPDLVLLKKNNCVINYNTDKQSNIIINDKNHTLTIVMKHSNVYCVKAKYIVLNGGTVIKDKIVLKIEDYKKPGRKKILLALQKIYPNAIALFDINIISEYIHPLKSNTYKHCDDYKCYIYDQSLTNSKEISRIYNEVHQNGKGQ